MNNKNIHILFDFKEGPWGGGNQFLKALRGNFINYGLYTEDIKTAQIIIFNSYPFRNEGMFKKIFEIKRITNPIIIHRVDGPVFSVRGKDLYIDKIKFNFNEICADGTIFQSRWSKKKSEELGLKFSNDNIIIFNSPNEDIFYTKNERSDSYHRKIKLIATSWSDNWRKGFDVYKYLDENLDISKYEMTFVGNSPVKFININHIMPVSSNELADILRENHIYITASRSDPCSNSLIEALHCGLPAVYLEDGGHPEIVNGAGVGFKSAKDVIPAIETLAADINSFKNKINLPNMEETAKRYYIFCEEILSKQKNGGLPRKKIGILKILKFKFMLYYYNKRKILLGLINAIRNRLAK